MEVIAGDPRNGRLFDAKLGRIGREVCGDDGDFGIVAKDAPV